MLLSSSVLWKQRHHPSIHRELAAQIQFLLRRDHQPRVQVLPSQILGAGSGVYATQGLLPGQVACLYPGVFTPPLPPIITAVDAAEGMHYLAGQLPPSGFVPEQNAYILNLKDVGGYLDGLAEVSKECNDDSDQPSTSTTPSPPEHDNPSACGHMVNHNPSTRANVSVVSFFWKHVFQLIPVESIEECYSLPNRMRNDKYPWYYDPRYGEVVYGNDTPDGIDENVCGAAMIVQKPIGIGNELFLDYGLLQPYPSWAKDWYFNDI